MFSVTKELAFGIDGFLQPGYISTARFSLVGRPRASLSSKEGVSLCVGSNDTRIPSSKPRCLHRSLVSLLCPIKARSPSAMAFPSTLRIELFSFKPSKRGTTQTSHPLPIHQAQGNAKSGPGNYAPVGGLEIVKMLGVTILALVHTWLSCKFPDYSWP